MSSPRSSENYSSIIDTKTLWATLIRVNLEDFFL